MLAVSSFLYGCGGSSSSAGPISSSDDIDDGVENEPSVVAAPTSDFLPTDVYDPDTPLVDVCASPYHQEVQGMYTGTIQVQDRGRRHCTWDVTLTAIRFYESSNVQGFCDYEVRYSGVGAPLEILPFVRPDGTEVENNSTQLTCIDFEVIGDYGASRSGFDELVDLEFPFEESLFLDRDIDLVNGNGLTVSAIAAPGAGSFESIIEMLYIGNGQITFPETQVIDPVWSGTLSRIADDFDIRDNF